MTLRRRVLLAVAGTALASCLLTVGVAVVLVRQRVAAQRLSALVRQAQVVAAVGGAPGALAAGEHVYRVGSGRPRRLRPLATALVLARIPDLARGQGTITVAGRTLLYAARATADGGVVLVRPDVLAFSEWRPFVGSLLLAGLGGALLAALVSLALARRITRPVAALAAATGHLAAGRPVAPVPVEGQDELASLARSFNRMAAALDASREAQRSFLESVSHELKTPLTSIRGYGEALGDGAVAPAQAGAVIVAEAGRLERLVSDLLELARLQRSEFEVRREPVDLADVAARAVERHRPRAAELSVALVHLDEGRPGERVLGDGDRLVQAVSNLVENALRLTPAGGSVTVRSAGCSISVQDTGPGLAGEELARAFERFYLYDRYRSERPVGSGLGLAIVRGLVERMGGSVEVASEPGAGATFTVRLPPA
jgi:two-component system OmpR family sensor kinase